MLKIELDCHSAPAYPAGRLDSESPDDKEILKTIRRGGQDEIIICPTCGGCFGVECRIDYLQTETEIIIKDIDASLKRLEAIIEMIPEQVC